MLKVAKRFSAVKHGPIDRLIDPSTNGDELKPFVFLDYVNVEQNPGIAFKMHPHSGIATLSWQPLIDVKLEDTTDTPDTLLSKGGVEWLSAGGGAWHKGEILGEGPVQGFQLWVALPPELELEEAEAQYVYPDDVGYGAFIGGNLQILLGTIELNGALISSPVYPPHNMVYCVLTLEAGAEFEFHTQEEHDVMFAFPFNGNPTINGETSNGDLMMYTGQGILDIAAGDEPAQVLIGSAEKPKQKLVLGNYSVHTSKKALEAGEAKIKLIGEQLKAIGRL